VVTGLRPLRVQTTTVITARRESENGGTPGLLESLVMSELADLQERLPQLMLRDHRRLQRRIESAQRVRRTGSRQAVVEEIATAVAAAERRLARRAAAVPAVSCPPDLPISQRTADLRAAIRTTKS
jgi:hypothetical protein